MSEPSMTTLTATPTAPRFTTGQGVILVGLGAVGFSTGIIFMRTISGLDATVITFYRNLIAFLFFCAVMIAPGRREALHAGRYQAHWPHLIVLGICMGLTSVLYTYAVQHTTAATAVLLNNSSPLYVALLAPWLLREARPRRTWLSLGLAALGMALLTGLIGGPAETSTTPTDLSGPLAALASGFLYALPLMIGRYLGGKVSSMTRIWWGSGVTALMLLPLGLGADFAVVVDNLPLLIPLGVISLGVSYLMVFRGLNLIRAQTASITALMEPVSGVLIGLLIFQETLTGLGAIGVGLILLAIVLISRQPSSPQPDFAASAPESSV
jgi:drug/metabolite transporter (DMT)-like permease